MSARDRLRDFFEKNVGRVVSTQELSEVARINQYARRVRELRDDEGMQIKSHLDRHDLKPGEYVLETLDRAPLVSKGIQPSLRQVILDRNGYTCQTCGAGPGDLDPFNPHRKVRLHIDHILPKSHGGTDDKNNLRVLCSTCNQAKGNIQPASESTKNLLARIRRAPRIVQEEVFERLKQKFEPKPT